MIVKHNNPCGAAISDTLESAYEKAYMADRVAAFGGCIALNRSVDKATAEAIANQYAEVVWPRILKKALWTSWPVVKICG